MSRFGQAAGSILQISSRPEPVPLSSSVPAASAGASAAAVSPAAVASPDASASIVALALPSAAAPFVLAFAAAVAFPALACAQLCAGNMPRATATRSPMGLDFIDASSAFPSNDALGQRAV